MIEIKHNLKVLIAQWEVVHRESLTLGRLAEETGVNVSTLARYTSGKSTRVDLGVCAKLLDFFNGDGGSWQYGLDDLFKMERVPPFYWHAEAKRGLKLAVDSVTPCNHCGKQLDASRLGLFLCDESRQSLEYLSADCPYCRSRVRFGIYEVLVKSSHDVLVLR